MNTRFKVCDSYNVLQNLCDFIHVLIFVTVSKCWKSPKLTNIVIVLAASYCIGDAKGARNQQKSKLVASSCKVLTSAIRTQGIVKKLCLVKVDRS